MKTKIYFFIFIFLILLNQYVNAGCELNNMRSQGVLRSEAVWFVDTYAGWLVGGDSIYYSGDGGHSWVKQFSTNRVEIPPFKISPSLSDIQMIDKNTGFAVGDAGRIFYTGTGGISWRQLNSGVELEQFGGVPIYTQLRSVSFIDKETGWVVGDGVILHTENGGLSWERQYFGIQHKLLKVFFVDKNNGWAVGYNGKILHTTTAGEKRFGFFGGWEEQKSGTGVHLYGLHFVDKNTGWAVGADEILHTKDGGKTWQVQSKDLAKHLRAVYFIDRNRGWVGGADTILYTNNGGKTWIVQASGNFQVENIQVIDEKYGWAVGGSGRLLRYVGDNGTGK